MGGLENKVALCLERRLDRHVVGELVERVDDDLGLSNVDAAVGEAGCNLVPAPVESIVRTASRSATSWPVAISPSRSPSSWEAREVKASSASAFSRVDMNVGSTSKVSLSADAI
jgi:hypothetical protein